MRIACILIYNLAVQVVLTGDPSLHGRSLIIGGVPFEARPVYDASPEAIACGVEVGMPLREAYSLCPTAEFLPLEESRYEQVFERVVSILDRFSPVVDIEKPGCAYIDISGVQDEASLCQEILRCISNDTGLSSCLGISNGKFFSRVAAFTTKPGTPVIVSPGQEKDFVAPFFVDLLPCSDGSTERLRLLGIRFIGELTRFSKEALVAQFGSDGSLMHDLAHGIDRSPLTPRAKPEAVAESIRLDSPLVSFTEILQVCEVMLGRLLSRVREQGKLCREVSLELGFASGKPEERRLALKEPTNSSRLILSRLQNWLETVKLSSQVVEVGLSLSLTKEQGKRLWLWSETQKTSQELVRMAEELKLRFGYQPIKKSRAVNPQPILPERRFTLTDVLE